MPGTAGGDTAGFTLIEILIVVLLIGILLAIGAPNFARARDAARTKSCISNMKMIDSAKAQWSIENDLAGTATPVEADVLYYMAPRTDMPRCAAGTSDYVLTAVDIRTVCPNVATHPDHVQP